MSSYRLPTGRIPLREVQSPGHVASAGRGSQRSKTRTVPFSADRYVILYYPFDRGIEVAAVIHGARDLEGLLRRGEL